MMQDNTKAESISEAKKKAAYMLGRRAMSKSELTDKLMQKGFTCECASKAADSCEELGFIDDREYADRLRSRYLARGYGGRHIKNECLRRGIDMEIIEEVLSEDNVPDAVDRFIHSRLKGTADSAELKRISRALHRRGFTWDEINAGIEKYLNDNPEVRD